MKDPITPEKMEALGFTHDAYRRGTIASDTYEHPAMNDFYVNVDPNKGLMSFATACNTAGFGADLPATMDNARALASIINSRADDASGVGN